MSRLPPMGEHEERRLRSEMAAWDDDRLISKTIKAQGLAEDIVARQILEERRRAADIRRHTEVLEELRKPQWKTPTFWLGAVAAITGCISVAPILWPKQSNSPASEVPKSAASVPLGGNKRASSQPLKSEPSASSPR